MDTIILSVSFVRIFKEDRDRISLILIEVATTEFPVDYLGIFIMEVSRVRCYSWVGILEANAIMDDGTR